MPAMKKTNSTGALRSPCFTPMIDSSEHLTPSTSKSTCTRLCIDCSSDTSLAGTPKRSMSCQSISRGTRSNAFTRSMKSTQVSRPCSRRLRSSCLSVKEPSAQPRCERKPHCDSSSSDSATGCSRALSTIETIL